MVEEHLERLQLPLMVNDKKNEENFVPALTVSGLQNMERLQEYLLMIEQRQYWHLHPEIQSLRISNRPTYFSFEIQGRRDCLSFSHGKEHNLKIISVADLIRYRRKRDQLVEHASAARIPTMWGPFTAHCFKSIIDGIEHIAMVKGDIGDGQDICPVHSECLTGDIFGSARCDCVDASWQFLNATN
ncbi:hypothetical protein HAX54_036816 [Datura stramonium]|uniref:GTP cyclohydrolase II domain-containing protein n=1 Tax=Datura stramonium TaxID=4076 RepID=A0ABS8RMI4_DATST|nr:hypothetical protein [Datura stramonium]